MTFRPTRRGICVGRRASRAMVFAAARRPSSRTARASEPAGSPADSSASLLVMNDLDLPWPAACQRTSTVAAVRAAPDCMDTHIEQIHNDPLLKLSGATATTDHAPGRRVTRGRGEASPGAPHRAAPDAICEGVPSASSARRISRRRASKLTAGRQHVPLMLRAVPWSPAPGAWRPVRQSAPPSRVDHSPGPYSHPTARWQTRRGSRSRQRSSPTAGRRAPSPRASARRHRSWPPAARCMPSPACSRRRPGQSPSPETGSSPTPAGTRPAQPRAPGPPPHQLGRAGPGRPGRISRGRRDRR